MLHPNYQQGAHSALVKLGLADASQPSPSKGDPAWDHTTDAPRENPEAPILPQEPATALGQLAKAAALGLKDMLFFENMLGPTEARNMFQGIERQMTGQGGGTHGTWTPQGVIPRPKPTLPPPAPRQPLGAQAAHQIISSAPPPLPPRAKLGVSGAMYAQALQGAAQRGGGRIAPQALGQVAAQPRAARSPFLGGLAREPGALAPSLPQQSAQAIMERVPWAGSEHGGTGRAAMQRFDQVLRGTGRLHAQPGVNQQIIEQFGYPAGQSPELAATVRKSTTEPTVAGRRR